VAGGEVQKRKLGKSNLRTWPRALEDDAREADDEESNI
jgi:hypothetical protein